MNVHFLNQDFLHLQPIDWDFVVVFVDMQNIVSLPLYHDLKPKSCL